MAKWESVRYPDGTTAYVEHSPDGSFAILRGKNFRGEWVVDAAAQYPPEVYELTEREWYALYVGENRVNAIVHRSGMVAR